MGDPPEGVAETREEVSARVERNNKAWREGYPRVRAGRLKQFGIER